MLNYIPPHAHNVLLNFEDKLQQQSRFNVVLNFSDSQQVQPVGQVDAVVNTRVVAQISGVNSLIAQIDATIYTSVIAVVVSESGSAGQVDVAILTSILAEVYGESISDYAQISAVINTQIRTEVDAEIDINHTPGIEYRQRYVFNKAIQIMQRCKISLSKAVSRAHLSAFFIADTDPILNVADFRQEQGIVLQRSIQAIHEVSTGLSSDFSFAFEDNLRIKIKRMTVFEQTKKLSDRVEFVWEELIRKRKQFTYSHEVAKHIEKTFTLKWDKSLEITTTNEIRWDQADATHYVKHAIPPILRPVPTAKPRKNVNLNFCCESKTQSRFNVILNFKEDKCALNILPKAHEKSWWYILNRLKVSRLDNGEEIIVKNGNYSADRSTWCWSHSLVVPSSQLPKLEPTDGQPVILKIEVNGSEHHMLLERRSRNRVFASDDWTLTGRSVTALLDAPYAQSRSFLQENERTAFQLCQAELDRVWNDAELDWQLYDSMSWIVPNNSFTYSNLSPIAAIKQLVESAGGFISSAKAGNKLTIKPLYKKTFMDSLQESDFDRLIPLGLVKSQSTDYEILPDYNRAYLISEVTGKPYKITRAGTGGDISLQMETNRLFTFESATCKGKALLAKAGLIEYHNLTMPIHNAVGECEPGELITFDEWWGTVDSVRVDYSHATVLQTIKVERTNRE